MTQVTEALRSECAAEWQHLLNDTFSTPMAVEHLAQFVNQAREQAVREAVAERDARIAELEANLALGLSRNDKFPFGTRVRKASGPQWVGIVVGHYSSSFTPEGLVIECTADGARGQVHVEPAKRMEIDNDG